MPLSRPFVKQRSPPTPDISPWNTPWNISAYFYNKNKVIVGLIDAVHEPFVPRMSEKTGKGNTFPFKAQLR
jgi:hypothetical protein